MRMAIGVATVALLAVFSVGSAAAQQGAVPQPPTPGVRIQTAPPAPAEREPRVVPPPLHYETTRPPDADYYPPAGPRVEHDPAFIEPLAIRYETPTSSGRAGISGWTSPNPPVGTQQTGWREVTGYFALGFSVTWDGPPAPGSRAR